MHLNLDLQNILERAQQRGQPPGLAVRVLPRRLPLLHRLELAREALIKISIEKLHFFRICMFYYSI